MWVYNVLYPLDCEVEKNETGWACNTYGERRVAYKVLEGET